MSERRGAVVEKALWSVEITITRTDDDRYLARVSFDEEPGWSTYERDDPVTALAAATRAIRREAVEQLGRGW
jgi:hypothetical protein